MLPGMTKPETANQSAPHYLRPPLFKVVKKKKKTTHGGIKVSRINRVCKNRLEVASGWSGLHERHV